MTHAQNAVDAPVRDRDAVDPELLELPGPPQGRRTFALVLMAMVAVAALAFAFSLRHDIAYFFSDGATTDLGDVSSVAPATLVPNTSVRIEGTPMLSRAVRYRRVLTGDGFAVFPLAGQRTIYVHVPDTPDALARTEFSGRLVTFSQLGARVGSVAGFLRNRLDLPVSGESFIILADESPGGSAWALLVALLCALVVVLDAFLILRWFRPLPAEGVARDEGDRADGPEGADGPGDPDDEAVIG